MPKELATNGAFWHISKFKFIPRKPAADAAFLIIDNSRLCLQVTLVEMLGILKDTTTLSCSHRFNI